MRSVSSQISWVNSRPASSVSCSSSWAAPRMPESGFLTSCASIAAIAVTERAALRWVSWRSILSAIERSCSDRTTRSDPSPAGAPWIVTERGANRGPSIGTSYSAIEPPLRRTASRRAKIGLCGGTISVNGRPDSPAALDPKNCSAAGLTKRTMLSWSSARTGSGSADNKAAASGSRGPLAEAGRWRRNELSIRPPRAPAAARKRPGSAPGPPPQPRCG